VLFRSTVFGAKAKIKISSDIPFISEKMGEVNLIAKLLNGPVFITKNGTSMGLSRWYVKVDQSELSDAKKELLKAIFPDALPRLIIRTDFEKNIHYEAKVHTRFAKIDVQGVFYSKAENNIGKAQVADFHFEVNHSPYQSQLLAKQVLIDYQRQKRSNPAYKPGKIEINIPKLVITSNGLIKPLKISVAANSSLRETDGYLNGFSKISMELLDGKQQEGRDIPINKASLSIMLKGLSSESFLRYSEVMAELDNLKQQAQWSLQENGEFPEGQDQIWQLYHQIEESNQQLPSLVLNDLFNKNSEIQLTVETENTLDQSSLEGRFTSVSVTNATDVKSSLNNEKNLKKGGGGYRMLLSNLEGQAQVHLDKKLFEFVQNFSSIRQSEFRLVLKDSKLLMQ